ncbi:hypothetical protein CerSpe_029450 [Prunus speciosa]
MLPWDEFPAKSGGVIFNNESDSDASSDIFEIESLTGKANPFLGRQASDAATSDCEDQQRPSPMKMVPNNTRNAKTRMNKDIPRHRPAALLGCKSQKSVKVAGDAHKTYHHEKTVPATRFQAETSPNNLTGFDSSVQRGTFLQT